MGHRHRGAATSSQSCCEVGIEPPPRLLSPHNGGPAPRSAPSRAAGGSSLRVSRCRYRVSAASHASLGSRLRSRLMIHLPALLLLLSSSLPGLGTPLTPRRNALPAGLAPSGAEPLGAAALCPGVAPLLSLLSLSAHCREASCGPRTGTERSRGGSDHGEGSWPAQSGGVRQGTLCWGEGGRKTVAKGAESGARQLRWAHGANYGVGAHRGRPELSAAR